MWRTGCHLECEITSHCDNLPLASAKSGIDSPRLSHPIHLITCDDSISRKRLISKPLHRRKDSCRRMSTSSPYHRSTSAAREVRSASTVTPRRIPGLETVVFIHGMLVPTGIRSWHNGRSNGEATSKEEYPMGVGRMLLWRFKCGVEGQSNVT